MKIKPTDADFAHACTRLWSKQWEELKAEAVRVAACRMLYESTAQVRVLLEKIQSKAHSTAAVLHMHEEIDKIWATHKELSRVAFPTVFKPEDQELERQEPAP